MNQVGKHMDVIAPLGWNWTTDDWTMYNFFRDLDSHGGVLSGGLFDRYVLLQYDKQHPAKSLVIVEEVPNERMLQIHRFFMKGPVRILHPNCRSVMVMPS